MENIIPVAITVILIIFGYWLKNFYILRIYGKMSSDKFIAIWFFVLTILFFIFTDILIIKALLSLISIIISFKFKDRYSIYPWQRP